MADKLIPKNSQIIIYRNENGEVKIDVRFDGETVWLTQKMMAELFDVEVNTVNYHLKEVFENGELVQSATIRKIRIVQKEGTRDVSRVIDYYNLDVIISVGYRVKSKRGTQFRIWANKVLKEYLLFIRIFMLINDKFLHQFIFWKLMIV